MSRLPYYLYKFYHLLYRYKIPFLPHILMYLNRFLWGAYIPPSCQLGTNTKFGYGGAAVVIHDRAIIGNNCIINPAVTIGGKSKVYNVPNIGNNVYIGGGAKLLGDIKIGNNVVIGTNAVVLNDIPDNTIVAGIPAIVIRENIDIHDYI